jgi:uncharacterized protein involved in exopolysaccharide biosynthesis
MSTPQEPDRASPLSPSEWIALQDYWRVWQRQRHTVMRVTAVIVGLGLLATLTRPPVYRATVQVLVTTTPTDTSDDLPLVSDLKGILNSRSVETQTQIIASPDLLQAAYRSLPPTLRRAAFGGDRAEVPAGAVRVLPRTNTNIIDITARTRTPAAASGLANAVARHYFARERTQATLAIRQTRQALEARLAAVQGDLVATEDALARVRTQAGLNPEAQFTRTIEAITQLQRDAAQARAAQAASTQALGTWNAALAQQAHATASSTVFTFSPEYQGLQQQLNTLTLERARLLVEYRPESAEVHRLDEQLNAVRAQLQRTVPRTAASRTESTPPRLDMLATQGTTMQATLVAEAARAQALEAEVVRLSSQLTRLPEYTRQVRDLTARSDRLRAGAVLLSQKSAALSASEVSTLSAGRIIAYAHPPQAPESPRPLQYGLLLSFVGIVVGGGVALVRDRRRQGA